MSVDPVYKAAWDLIRDVEERLPASPPKEGVLVSVSLHEVTKLKVVLKAAERGQS